MTLVQGLGSSTLGWLLLLGGAALLGGSGFFAGLYLAAWQFRLAQKNMVFGYERDSATDRHMILFLLRRELANWMLRQSPDRYVAAYKNAQLKAERILTRSTVEQEAEHDRISQKYPRYKCFDLIGTLEWGLYDETLNDFSFDEVASHYQDIVVFNTLQKSINTEWSYASAGSLRATSIIEEYVANYKDGILQKKIKDAIKEHSVFMKGKEITANYENNSFKVFYINHFAESRLGVHFKDTDEYGMRGVFVHDDGEASISYYRTDARFQNEKLLWPLVCQLDV